MYRFAVLPYANASPLVHFIPHVCAQAELVRLTPSHTYSELLGGRIDAAIVPIVDIIDRANLRMVPGLGICARGNVESVRLECRCPLKDVRTVQLDGHSRTSNVLAQVLFQHHFPRSQQPRFGHHLTNADASVTIGDRALCHQGRGRAYDLAGQWTEMTALPFVFAAWAYLPERLDGPRLTAILRKAKDEGCRALEELAAIEASRLGLTQQRCYHYLTKCLHYDVGPQEHAAMQLFAELARDMKLLPSRGIQKAHKSTIMAVPNDDKSRKHIRTSA